MEFKYFSKNGELRSIAEAVVPLSNIEYQYGFGVYESLRVAAGKPYFLNDHLERLEESARIIGLEHPFDVTMIYHSVEELIEKSGENTYNIKIVLLGSRGKEEAQLYILCLNPHFPDKKMYRDGAGVVTYKYERAFPHAKSLNMLESYLAYKKAKEQNCYDALLIDRAGNVIEGTRTNFFTIKGKTIYSPPEDRILLGVTRKAVLRVAAKKGFALEEQNIPLESVGIFDGAFITSTSSKIVPLASIDGKPLPRSQELKALMDAFDEFLDACDGKM